MSERDPTASGDAESPAQADIEPAAPPDAGGARPRAGGPSAGSPAVSGVSAFRPNRGIVWAGRIFAMLFMAWHGTATVASSLQEHAEPLAEVRRELTRPYEKLFGFHQSWTMFVPNPPRGTTYLRATGRKKDGTDIPLPTVVGAPDPDAIAWFYDRDGKYERNVTGSKRTGLQLGYTHWQCRLAKERGIELVSVLIEAPSIRTPKMNKRAKTPRPKRTRKVMEERRRTCPDWDGPEGAAP
ncbi:MAG: hypothetical protein H6742_03595 [Alphaproteobacteria bacterium]|nr:hypothetical protein [Alphaproteobacteria bacterium]